MRRELYAGVMSGTSLDGVDAVLADFTPGVAACALLAATHIDFPSGLRQELLALQVAAEDEIARAARAANALADLYVHALRSVCAAADIKAHDEQITTVASLRLRKTLFGTHPYHLQADGMVESVGKLKRDDLVSFHRRWCVAPNMVLNRWARSRVSSRCWRWSSPTGTASAW